MTNPKLWKRFERIMNTAYERETLMVCDNCPHATKTEKIEPRVDPKRFPRLDFGGMQ